MSEESRVKFESREKTMLIIEKLNDLIQASPRKRPNFHRERLENQKKIIEANFEILCSAR